MILDTGVLLEAGPRIAKIGWDEVLNDKARNAAFVIPIQVVEELAGQKMLKDERLRGQARYALKWMNGMVDTGNRKAAFPLAGVQDSGATIRVWVDENTRVPLPEVDRDIIDRAQQLKPFTKRTVIATMDQSMVLRARAYDVQAVLIHEAYIPARSSSDTSPADPNE